MALANAGRVVTLLLLLLLLSTVCNVDSLQSNYYKNTCPGAETAVANVVANAIYQDARVAPGLLRLFFHDCFVEGCDGSVLITSSSGDAEKDAKPNQSLHGFNIIDDAKASVEDICPKTVSCADVLAFAAAKSVAAVGGPTIDIKGGRLDGYYSNSNEANSSLPAPTDSLSQLQTLFKSKGLNKKDMVVLSGAHTIGKAHCGTFANRLSPTVDPSLNSEFADSLEQQCPSGVSSSTLVEMDVQTPTYFDNAYHQNVANGKGLFSSDADLYTNSRTSDYVNQYAANNGQFLEDFGEALIKMGKIGVKTGSNGNIRKICSAFN